MTQDHRNDGPGAGRVQSESDSGRLLDNLFEQISVERAPASLRRRLRRIPIEEQQRESWWRRLLATSPGARWALVPALAVSLLVVGVVLVMPRQPSEEDVMQARRDLAVAFSYIEEAGLATGQEIRSVLGTELRHSVKDNLTEHLHFTEQFRKEETS